MNTSLRLLGLTSLSVLFAATTHANISSKQTQVTYTKQMCTKTPQKKVRSDLHTAIRAENSDEVKKQLANGVPWDNRNSMTNLGALFALLNKIPTDLESITDDHKPCLEMLSIFLSGHWTSSALPHQTPREYLATNRSKTLKKCDAFLKAANLPHDYLARHGDVDIFDAVMHGGVEKFKALLQNGFDIDQVSKAGETALAIAVALDQTEVAIYLIQNGANVHVCDACGDSVLQTAVAHQNIRLIKHLVAAGANPDRMSALNETPFSMVYYHFNGDRDLFDALAVTEYTKEQQAIDIAIEIVKDAVDEAKFLKGSIEISRDRKEAETLYFELAHAVHKAKKEIAKIIGSAQEVAELTEEATTIVQEAYKIAMQKDTLQLPVLKNETPCLTLERII